MKKFLCLLIVCAIFLCSCGKEEVAPVNADFGGTIKLYAYEDDTFNPLKTKYQTNAQMFSAVMHRGLVKILPNGSVEYDLAESYTFSSDKLQIDFKLKDATFSDGSKIKAEDVVKSLDMLKENKENMYHVVFDFISGYSASGNTVTIKLNKPDSGVLCYMNFPILKEEKGVVIGAGAYKFTDGNNLTLSAVDSLKTNFSSVKILLCTKENMVENTFLNDEIDIINADYSNLARLQGKTGVKLTEYVSDNFTFIGINNENEILADVNVRRALASLINKKELTDTLMAGCAVAVNSPFKPGSIYGDLYAGEYSDITMFEKYLENADFVPEDLTFKILVNEDSISKAKAAQYICGVFDEAGIPTTVEKVDFDTYLQRINDGEYALFIGETTVALNQDFEFLADMTKYNNPNLDELFVVFRTETQQADKQNVAKDIAKMFVDELPVISLYYMKNTLITDGEIEGEFAPMQTNIISDISVLKIKK